MVSADNKITTQRPKKPVPTKQYESEFEHSSPVNAKVRRPKRKLQSESSDDQLSKMVSINGKLQAQVSDSSDSLIVKKTRMRATAQTDVEELVKKTRAKRQARKLESSASDSEPRRKPNGKRRQPNSTIVEQLEEDTENVVMHSASDEKSSDDGAKSKILKN